MKSIVKKPIAWEVCVLYLFTAVLALLIYQALNQNIEFTLKPHALAMYTLYQMRFEYLPDVGYMETQGLFVIGRNCLGGKLFICLFSIFTICRLSSYKSLRHKVGKVLSFCVISIVLAYFITMIRIAASIPFCETPYFKLIHTILSLMIYFGAVLALYAFLCRSRGENDIE